MLNRNFIKAFLFVSLFFRVTVYAQDINDIGPEVVDRLKLEGKLSGKEQFSNRNSQPSIQRIAPASNPSQSSTLCNCWIPRDSTWRIGQFDFQGGSGGPGLPPEYRNDDWSMAAIALPFNLCFYGTPVNQVFLNNNGNISIGAPYSTFTALTFPDATYKMIAPFWADVDTRNPTSGLVYYKVTPTHMIVQWENVGYFNTHADKFNTFQLIITNGSDPVIPLGQNVAFCYKDMQWTTGDASSGTNGFGGKPATVGVNQGNGIDYVQFGLFDQAGNNYDGAYGLNDGVDWLDNQSFTFNCCVSSANIPPVLNSLNVCDTITLCENTTYQLTANYLSPEQNEITNINFFSAGMTGVTVLSNTPGNSASLVLEIAGQTSNLGYHTVSVTAIDNGTPPAATNNNFVIRVLPTPLPSFTFSPASPMNPNTVVSFSNTTPPGTLLTWDFGDGSPTSTTINPQHTYTTPGIYTVTLTGLFPNGCSTSITQQIVIATCTPATFTVTDVCANTPSLITYTGGGSATATFNWNFNGGSILSGTGSGPYTIGWNIPGIYNVSLTVNEPNCSSTINVSVNVYANPVSSVSASPQLCAGDTSQVNFNGTAGSGALFTWNFNTAAVVSGSGSGPYDIQWNNAGNYLVSLIVSENGCSDTSQISVLVNPIPTSDFTILNSACINQPVIFNYVGTAAPGANYNWAFSGGNIITGSGQGPYSVSWNAAGNYQSALVVSENGCFSEPTTINAIVNPLPFVYAGTDQSVCSGVPVSLGSPPITGESYSWSPPINLSNPSISDPVVTPVNNSNTTSQDFYILTTTDANGCSNSDTVVVSAFPVPVINFIRPPAQCIEGNSFDLSAVSNINSGVNYTWTFTPQASLASATSKDVNVSYSSTGVFRIVLSGDYNGCPALSYIDSITIHPMPVSEFEPLLTEGCEPITVPFSNTSAGDGNTYNWNFGDGTYSSLESSLHVYQNPGVYSVSLSVTNKYGCTDDTSLVNIIKVLPVPEGNFMADPQVVNILAPFVQFHNYSVNASIYSWDFGDGNSSSAGSPGHTYSDTGNYKITLILTSDFGCIDTVDGYVRVEDNFYFYIPNAFTPNGDGVNDEFRGYGIMISEYEMNIYNRWGEIVYSTDSYDKPWDGKMKSGMVQNDVYVYRIELKDHHDTVHTFVGNVSVVK
jgi:gliding motility-associated-like protein